MNYKSDFDEVVALLNANLNTRHTKEFIFWKHSKNPFGRPLGAVAIVNETIVGVVFYLRYNFQRKNKVTIKCLRPIDGCTAKIHRGKGILKMLMKYCLELYNNDYDMLIATPNKYSYPEFLKLGWKNLENRYSYKIGIISPFGISKNVSITSVNSETYINHNPNTHNYFVTSNIPGFFKWRYQESLDSQYIIKKILVDGQYNFVIYHIRNFNGLKYIVLCDFIGGQKNINNVVRAICKMEKLYFVYYLSNKITDGIKFLLKKKHGEARITIREDNAKLHDDVVFSLSDLSL
ncbi:GNAT family N-acetyltransferase [Gillisia sp. Q332]|uniref:GNAT family N-acetyltransferase n=1 Tax=Gillisia xinjiangensis TaxID=3384765 RepID=UPI003918F01F